MIQVTGALVATAIDTVPETVEPLAGDEIVTPPVGVGVGAGVAVLLGVGVGFDLFLTETVLEAFPTTAWDESYAVAEIVCSPLLVLVDIHDILLCGVDAK